MLTTKLYRLITIAALIPCYLACSPSKQESNTLNSKEESNALSDCDALFAPDKFPCETPFPSAWQILPSQNGVIALVGAFGKGPDGEIKTTLLIQCPTPTNDVTAIEFIVHKTGTLRDFDFDSFEGPYAPNLTKRLVEFHTTVGERTDRWSARVSGRYGGLGDADAFYFTLVDSQSRLENIAKAVSRGEAVLMVIAHDGRNWNRTLEAQFPRIDPDSETASRLHGCKN